MLHYRKLKIMMLMLLFCVAVKAQFVNGKVYNFVNVANSGQSLTITSGDKVSIAATDQEAYAQLWYVSGNSSDGYTLRNLASGRYLRSSNATSINISNHLFWNLSYLKVLLYFAPYFTPSDSSNLSIWMAFQENLNTFICNNYILICNSKI